MTSIHSPWIYKKKPVGRAAGLAKFLVNYSSEILVLPLHAKEMNFFLNFRVGHSTYA